MAGSRLEKVGSIFSRVTGLMRAGALKEEDKPIWYDIYRAFPPKYEPKLERAVDATPIPPIFYPEDEVRARFYKAYPNAPIDLRRYDEKSVSQKFVEKYQSLKKERSDAESSPSGDVLFRLAADALVAEGVVLGGDRGKGSLAGDSERSMGSADKSRPSVEKSSILEMYKEAVKKSSDQNK